MSTHAQDAIHQLIQMGIRHYCICPGSRSTPLTLAVARHPEAISHIFHDERSAAFCALGFGKSGKLAALIVTSGTAVANAYPAVIEADASNTPMLLLTADRPPELRATNANQTIDQVKIFGNAVRFFFDFPCSSNTYSIESQRNTLSFAVSNAIGSNSGPVHLNWMFREPFDVSYVPAQTQTVYPIIHHGIQTLTNEQQKYLIEQFSQSHAGLLVVGELTSSLEQKYVQALIQQMAWPVIIDASSGLRIQNIDKCILAWEDILRTPPANFQPDLIVQLGNGLCSKRYELWLKELLCPIIVVNPRPISSNPGSASIHRFQCSVKEILKLSEHCSDSLILTYIIEYNNNIKNSIYEFLSDNDFNDIQIINTVLRFLPSNTQVFIGNSMPIRDVNNYLLDCSFHLSTSNRGASGIDGLTSTAFGWMLGHAKPTLVLLGDLSLMHDWGVLFTISQATFTHSLIIVVINNGGGGIFSMLPISKESDVFESHFATSHAHDFTPILKSMGISAHMVSSLQHFSTLYAELWEKPQLHVIEFKTNRAENMGIRKKIQQYVQEGWHKCTTGS